MTEIVMWSFCPETASIGVRLRRPGASSREKPGTHAPAAKRPRGVTGALRRKGRAHA
jgi:hypothetical protein